MIQKIAFFILLLSSFLVSAQNEQLALQYFDDGAFEKALSIFEENAKKQPSNYYFFQKIIECHQELQNYDAAEKAILQRRQRYNQQILLVELGYNFQLQKKEVEAKKQYELALKEVEKEPNYAYQVAGAFEKKVLLDWAIKTYEIAQKINPKLNFDYQTGMLQGQLGNLDIMLEKLLDYGYNNPDNTALIQNQLTRFLADDATGNFAESIRKSLL